MSKKSRRKYPGLIEYLEKRLGSARGNTAEQEFFCPFCIDRLGDEAETRKLYINIVTGKAFCFRCQYGAPGLQRLFRDLNGGSLRFVELALIRGEMEPIRTTVRKAVLAMLYEDDESAEELKPVPMPPEAVSLSQCQWDSPPMLLRHPIRYLRDDRGINRLDAIRFDVAV